MIRKYKKTLILSSLLTLLPILVGLLLWEQLPRQFATHWGLDGQADGWSSLPFAVFCPPIIMLALQWLCIFFTARDPGNKDQNTKPLGLVLWIIPFLSNMTAAMMYALALGAEFSPASLTVAALGLMFIAIGNYLPKCKMNATLGIKVSWAYTSEENWNATHRFGGKVWFLGGIAMMLCGLVPDAYGVTVMLFAMLVLIFIPVIYSYVYYRRQKARGDNLLPPPKFSAKSGKLTAGILCVTLVVVALILFSGNVSVDFGETSFTVDATFYDDLTVDYAAIDSLEYREGSIPGTRVFGFGSLKLLLGSFENEEFGIYTRYTYYSPDACIVLTVGDKVLVLSGKTAAETQAIYEALLEHSGA